MSRRIKVLAMVAALIAGLVPSLGGVAQAAPGCQQVLLVFARGSGAELDNREAKTFFEKVGDNLGSVRHDSVQVGDLDQNEKVDGEDYPAVAWPRWFGPDARGVFDSEDPLLMGGYNTSRSKGTEELVVFLNARAVSCPDETVVLGGHSQGAHVVGAALPELTPAAAGRVAYVALFGDPKFNPGGELSRLSVARPRGRGATAAGSTTAAYSVRANRTCLTRSSTRREAGVTSRTGYAPGTRSGSLTMPITSTRTARCWMRRTRSPYG